MLVQCGQPGECQGLFIHNEIKGNELECMEMCQDYQICSHYNFNNQSLYCAALASCDSISDAPGSVWGERSCYEKPAPNYTALMVVGGSDISADVEVIDLSGSKRTCAKPRNYPSNINQGSTGIFFDNYPTVCGGTNVGSPLGDLCYKYDYKVKSTQLISLFGYKKLTVLVN